MSPSADCATLPARVRSAAGLAVLYVFATRWSEDARVSVSHDKLSIMSDSVDTTASIQQARDLLTRGESYAARTVARRALANAPNNAELHAVLGDIECETGEEDAAALSYQHALDHGLRDADVLARYAATLRRLDRLDEAIAAASSALDHEPDSARALVQRALARSQVHEYEGALADFQRAVKLLPVRRTSFATASNAASSLTRTARRGRREALLRVGWGPIKPICRRAHDAARAAYDKTLPYFETLSELLAANSSLVRARSARIQRLAWHEAEISALEELASRALVILLTVTYFGLLAATTSLPARHGLSSGDEAAALLLATFLGLAVTMALIAVSTMVLADLRAFVGAEALCGVLAAIISNERTHLPVLLGFAMESGFAVAAAWGLLLVGSISALAFLSNLVLRRLRRAHPMAATLLPLLRLATPRKANQYPESTRDVRADIFAIERASEAARWFLRSLEQTGDRRTNAWLARQGDGVASAMRELKMWLLTPGEETRQALRERVSRDLVAITEGRWRDLPWTDPTPINVRTRRVAALALLRNAVVGFLPVVVLTALEATNTIRLSGSASNQATFAVVVWAVITILIAVDPGVQEKLAAVRSVLPDPRK
jgi:tetratricopeptide (TPR) repeat protein